MTQFSGARMCLQIAVDGHEIPSVEQIQQWSDKAIVVGGEEAKRALNMTVRIVSEVESQELNVRFRGQDKPTNVLAFPFDGGELPTEADADELGDLAICITIVEREAAEQSKSTKSHLAHMVVHGTLHLLGYDHLNDADAEAMESREREAMQSLGFQDPYQLELS
jgi:probable rRNA maturation factor